MSKKKAEPVDSASADINLLSKESELLGYALSQLSATSEFLFEDCTCAHVCFLFHSVAKDTIADGWLTYEHDLILGVSAKDELITFDHDFDAGDLALTSHSKESR